MLADEFGEHVLIVEPSDELALKPGALKANAAKSQDADAAEPEPADARAIKGATEKAADQSSKSKKKSHK